MKTLSILVLALSCAGCAKALDAEVQSIHALKVRDAMNGYAQASAPMDRCVRAKLVAIAYEDARDPASASAWRAREKADCEAAIVAMGVELPARPGS